MKRILIRTFTAICAFFALVHGVAFAQPQPPDFTDEEQRELDQLVEQLKFPMPDAPTIAEMRILLRQLQEYATPFLSWSFEKLTVCEVSGNPHLAVGDVIYLDQIGSSANLRMTVVRNEGANDQSNPWTDAGGNPVIIVNPSILKKPHANPAYKSHSPEGVGLAKIIGDGHTPAEQAHPFSFRRDTRANWPNPCTTAPGKEELLIFVAPHEGGTRHGGHARAK